MLAVAGDDGTDYGGHMSWHHLHENRFGFHQQQRQQQQHNILYVATCVLVLIWKYPKIDESQHFGDVSLTSAAFSLFLSSSRIFLPLQSQRIACYSTFSIHAMLVRPFSLTRTLTVHCWRLVFVEIDD